jgi:hypothetical protein
MYVALHNVEDDCLLGCLHLVVSQKLGVDSNVFAASIALRMEAVSTAEASVNFYEITTRQNPRRQSSSCSPP